MKIFRWTALLLTLAVSAIAQTQPAKYQTVFTVNVKPGMTQQYETYVKKIVEAAEKIGDVQNWATFNLTVGGGPAGNMPSSWRSTPGESGILGRRRGRCW